MGVKFKTWKHRISFQKESNRLNVYIRRCASPELASQDFLKKHICFLEDFRG
jgi:hypothetical protein